MADFAMTIDGSAVDVGAGFGVVNPSTARVFARAPACSPEQLDRAMAAAARAYSIWSRAEDVRRAVLREASATVLAATGELAALLTAEQGKPRTQAAAEVRAAGAWLRYYADVEFAREPVRGSRRTTVEVRYRPLGVLAAITPWTSPLALAARAIAPALRAGNTVVLKPSPHTPLATLVLGRLLGEVLPPGVLNVVSGPAPLGARLVGHPTPRGISFTGSAATGRRVAAAATDRRRAILELGSNDPAIVLDDVDPEALADALFWSAFANNGQDCTAVKRVYVAQPRYRAVLAALADRAGTVRVGNGNHKASQLGPVGTLAAFERVGDLVRDALAHGAVAAAGGAALNRPGYFFAPTVLGGVSDGVRVVEEEQLGPVLPVIGYRDLDAALRRADGSGSGLGASVWSADEDRAAAVAARLTAARVAVNSHPCLLGPDPAMPDQPMPDLPGVGGLVIPAGQGGPAGYTARQLLIRPGRSPGMGNTEGASGTG